MAGKTTRRTSNEFEFKNSVIFSDTNTTVTSTNLTTNDPVISVNSGNTAVPAGGSGIEVTTSGTNPAVIYTPADSGKWSLTQAANIDFSGANLLNFSVSSLTNLTVTNFTSDNVNIGGGEIDATPIGVNSHASGKFTDLTATGTVNLGSFSGSEFTGNVTGNLHAQDSSLMVNSQTKTFTGALSGAVTGDVTGDVTGTVTGSASLNLLLAGGTLSGTVNSQNLIPSAGSTYNLGAVATTYAGAFIDTVTSTTMTTEGISIGDNSISGRRSNDDINITPSGTGAVVAGAIRLSGSTISSDDSTGVTIGDELRVTTIAGDDSSQVTINDGLTVTGAVVMLSSLPTSDPSNAGQLWNDSGDLKISAG